jgi:hypothetical protein
LISKTGVEHGLRAEREKKMTFIPAGHGRIQRLEALVRRALSSAAAALAALNGNTLQAGETTLALGASPFIAADVTATSAITIGIATAVGDVLTNDYGAIDADRVVGLASAGGGFVVRAFLAAGRDVADTNVADTSTVGWIVVN